MFPLPLLLFLQRSVLPADRRFEIREEEYVERGIAHFEAERCERRLRHLRREAGRLNLALVPAEQAARVRK